MRAQTKTKARVRLSRKLIADTALKMAEETSVEEVTLRKVARRLGVTPMALYKHVTDKEELEQLIAAELLRKTLRPIAIADDTPWQDIIRGAADDLRRALLEHRSILRVFVGEHFFLSREMLVLQEHFHDAFTRCGLPVEEHRTMTRIIGNFIIGSVFISLYSGPHPFEERLDAHLRKAAEERSGEASEYPHLEAAFKAAGGASPTRFDICFPILMEMLEMRAKHSKGVHPKAPRGAPALGKSRKTA